MTVAELIAELSQVHDLNSPVSIVVGENNDNCVIHQNKITVQVGLDTDTDTDTYFVEVCSFSNEED